VLPTQSKAAFAPWRRQVASTAKLLSRFVPSDRIRGLASASAVRTSRPKIGRKTLPQVKGQGSHPPASSARQARNSRSGKFQNTPRTQPSHERRAQYCTGEVAVVPDPEIPRIKSRHLTLPFCPGQRKPDTQESFSRLPGICRISTVLSGATSKSNDTDRKCLSQRRFPWSKSKV
jgi:hypothetical protein